MKNIQVSKDVHIYSNPNTKQGRESYVRYEDEHGWCFDYGQAWINLKFRSDINKAIADMIECTEIITGSKRIKKGNYEVRE